MDESENNFIFCEMGDSFFKLGFKIGFGSVSAICTGASTSHHLERNKHIVGRRRRAAEFAEDFLQDPRFGGPCYKQLAKVLQREHALV